MDAAKKKGYNSDEDDSNPAQQTRRVSAPASFSLEARRADGRGHFFKNVPKIAKDVKRNLATGILNIFIWHLLCETLFNEELLALSRILFALFSTNLKVIVNS